MSLRPLLDTAFEDESLRSLAAAAREPGDPVAAYVSAGLRAYLLAALLEADFGLEGRPALVTVPDDRAARDLAADLKLFIEPRPVLFYPSRGISYESHLAPPPHLVGLRTAALDALLAGRTADLGPPVIVASAIALAEKVPDPARRPSGFSLRLGESVDLRELAELLADCGYEATEQVEERGEFAVRGGILDVYPVTEERAVRIDLFGDEVESLRWFSTFTQRSLGEAERVDFAPAIEMVPPEEAPGAAESGEGRPDIAALLPLESFVPFLGLLPEDAAVVVAGSDELPGALADHWEDLMTGMHAEDARQLYVDVADELHRRAAVELSATSADQPFAFRAQGAESPARSMREAEAELEKLVRSGYRAVVAFDRRGEAERARYNLGRLDAAFLDGNRLTEEAGLWFAEAPLREGFIAPQLKLALFPHRRLVHRRRAARPPARGRLRSFSDLRVGDFVVHSDHGVARFAGFETKTVADVTRDYLHLEFRGEDRVFVPWDQVDKVSRYLGADGHAPTLSKLGGSAWENVKARARKAARAMAGELLNLYAERRTRRGHAFSPDGEWQVDFERAFPFRETPDQIEAIDAVKADMEAPRPMDRLICGDVGYGKTEVALRAAHKCAVDDRQCLMLVPTTVLAQQHFGTFRERMADTPFSVAMVSRFRKPAENRAALEAFAEGKIDILIGTHRLLSRDVRPKELGLLIVDEEQRFGVKQKELLRQMRLRVDVISLSATPIPRTLQMSLSGLRDISIIETPPEGRRPVRTHVGPYEEALVKRAIEREVDRGGQVFYLHNRIDTLAETAAGLRALCPGIRIAEAHGQMDEAALERTMLDFLRGEGDCLVATTIIEAGLDIPNANTLIVERADQLGLAQAYQIRGRVGRARERAYAYLLYPSAAALSPEAAARLATLSDYTELGSGFKIAMRDLDIRGAGNLLGDEQSGHVAAVGFELYVSMIDEAVAALSSEEDREDGREPVRLDVDVDAYVPADYVPFEAAKIDVHRRIAAARERADLVEIREELEDRFGPVPEPVTNLMELQRARIDFGLAGARTVGFRQGRVTAAPIELDSSQAKELRERIPAALYEWRDKTVAMKASDDPRTRFAEVTGLAAAVLALSGTAAPPPPAAVPAR
jgi:transcription-repair coupling factor (superfamily II helicase)